MNYCGISKADIANGEGIRVVLWVSGCNHHCPGCQNPETWNENYGKPFDNRAKENLFHELAQDYCDGITFSGGDPFYKSNAEEIFSLAKEIKENFPTKNIWLYTGDTYKEILHKFKKQDLDVIDVMVTGPFIESKKTYSTPWIGSDNQRIIRQKN